MRDLLKGSSYVLSEPETFSQYITQQVGRAVLTGEPFRSEVMKLAPSWVRRMGRCEDLRARAREERGLHVPAVMFMAITGRCNFRCRHCYTQMYAKAHMEMPLARRILAEGHELGVGLIVVSGGEPLLHRQWFELPRQMLDVPFVVFTNGSLVEAFLAAGLHSPNILWLVSADGPRPFNDARRGEGSFDIAIGAMESLRSRNLPFGFSATLSVDNVDAGADPEFVASMVERGCRYGFFLEQVPGPPSDPPVGDRITEGLIRCRAAVDIPIVGFPADEIRFGGCQAGGNGISHVSPDGYLEPCPAARLAADSLAEVSLATALSNPFFKEFRELKARFGAHESCSYSGREETFEQALARYGAHATV